MSVDSQPAEETPAAGGEGSEAHASAPAPEAVEVAALREELERTERQLQAVVDRYEALLAERSRATRGDDSVRSGAADDAGRGWRARLRSLL